MPFTSEEIQASVEQLVRANIRRPYDTLGVRQTDVSFTDIQEAAAGVFLLYPRAPFYCLWLGTQKVLEDLANEEALLNQLDQTISALGRKVLPISDVTSLFNARAALRELATSRTGALKDITKAPAFQRFKDNTDRFLSEAGPAIKDDGEIVQTPNEARLLLPKLITSLKTLHEGLIESATSLARGLENYNSLSLASLVSQSVLDNALKLVNDHAEDLSSKTPAQRLEVVRQVVLDLIASKSVVTQFGSFGGAVDIYSLTGTGVPYADADHPALPASLMCPRAAPFNINPEENLLDVYLDAYLTPRTPAFVDSISAAGDNAVLHLTAGFPADVLVGDIVLVADGGGVTRWVITSFNGPRTEATAYGPGVVPVLGATGVEILPPPSAAISLPYSYAAQILGTQPETVYSTGTGWIIGNGSAPARPTGYGIPNNDHVKLKINGADYDLTLTLSGAGSPTVEAVPRTAEQICADLNAGLSVSGYMAEPYLSPRRYYGRVNKVAVAGPTADFNLPGGFGNFGSLSVVVGDYINVLSGTETGLWTITQVHPTYLRATKVGGGTAVDEALVTIEVGPAQRHIRIVPQDYRVTVGSMYTIQVVDDQGVGTRGAGTLGLPAGALARSRKSTAKDVADGINKATSLVRASASFVATGTTLGKGKRGDTLSLSTYRFSAVVETNFLAGSPNTLIIPVAGALTAGVVVGDVLVLRTGGFVGTVWNVTAVTDNLVTATSTDPGDSETLVQIDIGPDLGLGPFDMVRVTTGPNQGDYYLSAATPATPLDLPLSTTLASPTDATTGLPVEFTVQLGKEYLSVASRDTTTASRVTLRGNVVGELFDDILLPPYPLGAIGSTYCFQLPATVRGLEQFDILQLFDDDYGLPSAEYSIAGIDGRLITLSWPIPSSPSWEFGSIPTPFARLKAGSTFDFAFFKQALEDWLASSTQQQAYFTELYRRINPLISNVSPAASDIGDARTQLHDLAKVLSEGAKAAYGGTLPTLEAALQVYTVRPLGPVDALIRSYKEKGADRAIDLLLSGLFQEFFGATAETSSYAGDFQAKMRDVVMNDLPVKKTNRKDAVSQKLIGTAESPDLEYNLADTEGQGIRPDPV